MTDESHDPAPSPSPCRRTDEHDAHVFEVHRRPFRCPGITAPADTETDEERADREETERDHARGDHTHCGLTCEATLPTEQLRDFIVAKGFPGTKGALTELLRRAEAAAPSAPADGDLRDRIAQALYAHNHPGWATRYTDLDQDEQDTYLARASAVLTVLPAPTDQAAALLRDTETYLTVTHTHARRHDDLAADYTCAGCQLRDRIAALPTQAAAPPPQDRAAVLREAADRIDSMSAISAAVHATAELRRMADETQQT